MALIASPADFKHESLHLEFRLLGPRVSCQSGNRSGKLSLPAQSYRNLVDHPIRPSLPPRHSWPAYEEDLPRRKNLCSAIFTPLKLKSTSFVLLPTVGLLGREQHESAL